ncbi:hypothetical protein ACFYR1_34195 [Streptomyces canus]|uniref:hypothetical protein n=1 Tax=Streptomyces canus TaxID=58343 RepID=UPI0036B39BBD
MKTIARAAVREPAPRVTLVRRRLACPDITGPAISHGSSPTCSATSTDACCWSVRQAEQDAPKPVTGFAGFLGHLDAVTAGVTLPWSSGVTEGHMNRVKAVKRAMYGRASVELLRTRVLTSQEAPRAGHTVRTHECAKPTHPQAEAAQGRIALRLEPVGLALAGAALHKHQHSA